MAQNGSLSFLVSFDCFTSSKDIHIHIYRDFFGNFGKGPRAFLIGKISYVNPEYGKISKHSKLTISSKLT